MLATRGSGKLRELAAIVREAGLDAVTLEDLALPALAVEDEIERHSTFRENALAKARHFFARCGGLPVIAEDSGLEVSALGGRPGVHSKRWSGRSDLTGRALDAANNEHLIASLRGVSDRSARYVCEAVLIDASSVRTARGESAGEILDAPRGTEGFGYDPHFLSRELGVTFAEATMDDKARVSHRGRALRALLRAKSSFVD